MKSLNENEKKVLKACIEDSENNGLDFGFSDEVIKTGVEGLKANQIKGYLSQLQRKGYIEIEDAPGECYNGQLVVVNVKEIDEYWEKSHDEILEILLTK